jgi:zinc transporter ZupT
MGHPRIRFPHGDRHGIRRSSLPGQILAASFGLLHEGIDRSLLRLGVGVMTVHSFTEGIGVGVSFGGGETLGLFITAAIAVTISLIAMLILRFFLPH